MKEDEARAIYRTFYFTQPGFERLPSLIQPQMFDIAVNSGPSRAVRLLQNTLNTRGFGPLAEDGRRGPLTDAAALTACRALGGARMNNALLETRIAFYRGLVAADPSQQVFLNGWLKRAEEFREAV